MEYENYYAEGTTLIHSERFQWVINTFTTPKSGAKILEIGCGDAGCIYFLKQQEFEVYGAEYSESAIQRAALNNLEVIKFDASSDVLPFANDFFDIVICLETYEHLRNPQHCTEEILRVLKTNGQLVVSVPNPHFSFESHGFLYPCLFRVKNFVEYFHNNGFQVGKIKPHVNCSLLNKLVNSPKSPLSYLLPKSFRDFYKNKIEQIFPYYCASYSNLYCMSLIKVTYKNLYDEIEAKTSGAYTLSVLN